jgi:ankyrin repeat protein
MNLFVIYFNLQWGRTPLLDAAQEGHTEVCKLLLEKGADVNRGDNVSTNAHSLVRTEASGCALQIIFVQSYVLTSSLLRRRSHVVWLLIGTSHRSHARYDSHI